MKSPQVKWVWAGGIALFLLHQDFWFWDSRSLVFGFLPVGLFYHALFSLAAGALWFMAVRYAWPSHIEAWADEPAEEQDGGGTQP